jgi:hypothetical protein
MVEVLVKGLADPATLAVVQPRPVPQSLINGAAAVALLHVERARAAHGDWRIVHAWLSAAVSDELAVGPDACLFFGAPALAFVAHAATDRRGRYAQAAADLHAATRTVTRERLRAAHDRIDRGDRPVLAEFDLIRGLTGLGAYHLYRDPHDEMTAAVLGYLVRLTEPHGDRLPGWWTDQGPAGRASPDYPGGHANLGMAHGIAGPLALLALARRRGVSVAGHLDAIARICAWLDAWRQDDHPAGPWWPRTISRADLVKRRTRQEDPKQPSWCYGTPGLARAQQLAGLATGDLARQHVAETAVLGCLTDPAQVAELGEIGLCHGLAGLLHTAFRMTEDAPTGTLAAHLVPLADAVAARLDPLTPQPDLLNGAVGAALTLTAVVHGAVLSGWDACLLLS